LSATSLKEFREKVKEVNMKSLEFHFYRGDFEKWLTEVLGDKELAIEIEQLRKVSLTSDVLRHQLYATVSRRLKHLMSLNNQAP